MLLLWFQKEMELFLKNEGKGAPCNTVIVILSTLCLIVLYKAELGSVKLSTYLSTQTVDGMNGLFSSRQLKYRLTEKLTEKL